MKTDFCKSYITFTCNVCKDKGITEEKMKVTARCKNCNASNYSKQLTFDK